VGRLRRGPPESGQRGGAPRGPGAHVRRRPQRDRRGHPGPGKHREDTGPGAPPPATGRTAVRPHPSGRDRSGMEARRDRAHREADARGTAREAGCPQNPRRASREHRPVILRSPTRHSRYGDGASGATKDLLPLVEDPGESAARPTETRILRCAQDDEEQILRCAQDDRQRDIALPVTSSISGDSSSLLPGSRDLRRGVRAKAHRPRDSPRSGSLRRARRGRRRPAPPRGNGG
jgi:hypothetical protein